MPSQAAKREAAAPATLMQLGLLIVLILLSPSIDAAVLRVPSGFGTIQAAVLASVDGDEIVVSPGTYHEAVNLLGRKIRLRSSDGPEVTILDGSTLNTSILLAYKDETLDTVVQGFTFRNGKGIQGIFWIGCELGGRLGGAIYLRRAGLTILDCRFEDNGPVNAGGAIFACQADLIVKDTELRRNQASFGGAISYDTHTSTTGQVASFDSVTFAANVSAFGGGLRANLYGSSTMDIAHCLFDANEGDHGGGALIRASATSRVTISDDVFTSGISDFGGGANVAADSHALIEVSRSLFKENDAAFGGGLFVVASQGAEGGGKVNVNVTDSRFVANVARPSAASVISPCQRDGDENGQFFGGGIDIHSIEGGRVTVTNSLIAGNSAIRGGGVSAMSCGPGGEVAFVNCTIVNNEGNGIDLRTLTAPFLLGVGRKRLANLIVRENRGGMQIMETGPEIFVAFSNVESGYAGAGNIDAVPSFLAPAEGDYRLASGSAGIDAGDNSALDASITRDLAGAPRFIDDASIADTGSGMSPIVDHGAYEYQPPGTTAPATTEPAGRPQTIRDDPA